MKFQLSYFKSWEMMLWKCCTQYASKFGKTQQWPQDWKRSVFIPIPKKGNAKECSNYRTIALISHASKVMLKILQVRLQQYVNCELPVVQAGFRKGRGTRYQIANIRWIIKKAREFQKNHVGSSHPTLLIYSPYYQFCPFLRPMCFSFYCFSFSLLRNPSYISLFSYYLFEIFI